MDAHVTPHLFVRPADLLARHRPRVADYAAEHFGCGRGVCARALAWLGNAEALLRGTRLPQLLLHGAGGLDARLRRRFDWYIAETAARLGQINRVIEGDAPVWHAEIDDATKAVARVPALPTRAFGQPLPQDFF
jgi:hypothetical protein